MKIYLEDIREWNLPQGWTLVKTAQEAIDILKTGKVEAISLDHDLQLTHYAGNYAEDIRGCDGSGMDVVKWMQHQVFILKDYSKIPSIIRVHSRNEVKAPIMKQDLIRILKEVERLKSEN